MELPIHSNGPCPHCDATMEERGRHAHQGYCEACNGEPDHLAHIAYLKAALEDIEIVVIKNPANCAVDESTLVFIHNHAREALNGQL